MTSLSRSVVITGASSGIGAACAWHLAEAGWQVFAGVRKKEDAKRIQEYESDRLVPVLLDVTDAAILQRAVEFVETHVGEAGLTGLVHSAGISAAEAIEFHSLERFRKVLEVNVVGTVATTQAFLPLLRKQSGRVVSIGSSAGWQSMPFFGAYGASKWALVGLTQSLRLELQPWGLTAVVVEPGPVRTPIWDKTLRKLESLVDTLPARQQELYADFTTAMVRTVQREVRFAIDPESVARVVERALTTRRPKLRYLVGTSARAMAFFSLFVPSRFRDRLLEPLFSAYSALQRLLRPRPLNGATDRGARRRTNRR